MALRFHPYKKQQLISVYSTPLVDRFLTLCQNYITSKVSNTKLVCRSIKPINGNTHLTSRSAKPMSSNANLMRRNAKPIRRNTQITGRSTKPIGRNAHLADRNTNVLVK